MLRPYLNSRDSELCPNNRRRVSGDVRVWCKAMMNYGANHVLLGFSGGHKVADVRNPAATFMLMDATTYQLAGAAAGSGLAGYGAPYCASGVNVASAIAAGHGCQLSSDGARAIGCDNGRVYDGAASPSGRRQYDRVQDLMGRHFDGLNVCYVDGHVRWMSGREMVALSRRGISIEAGGLNPKGYGESPWSPQYEG
jgi:prepilin-type processing-associated H-X9-DG protein